MDPLNELLSEVREIRRDTAAVKVTLAEQHLTLLDHTRRSILNEAAVELQRTELNTLKQYTATEIQAFKEWTAKWAGAWTALGVVATLAAVAASVAKVLGAF